jgi:hypothetical protein
MHEILCMTFDPSNSYNVNEAICKNGLIEVTKAYEALRNKTDGEYLPNMCGEITFTERKGWKDYKTKNQNETNNDPGEDKGNSHGIPILVKFKYITAGTANNRKKLDKGVPEGTGFKLMWSPCSGGSNLNLSSSKFIELVA